MGLADAIKQGVAAAMSAVSDLSQSSVIYRDYHTSPIENISATDFDPSTGGTLFSGNEYTDYSIDDYVLVRYSQKDIEMGIAGPNDYKLIFLCSNIPVSPDLTGQVLIDDELFHIKEPIKQDPAKAVWMLMIVKP